MDNIFTCGSLIRILNHQSGFGAIAGVADSRDLEDLYFKGDENAILAIEMFCYRIAKYMASYFVPLEGLPQALPRRASCRQPTTRGSPAKSLGNAAENWVT